MSRLSTLSRDSLLVTGASGRLGTALAAHLAFRASEANVEDERAVAEILERARPQIVLHLAAIANQKQAEAEKEASYRTNVIGTRNVAREAARRGIKCVYTSTDYVFAGITGGYREEDPPAPANWYGFTKYAGELEVRAAGGEHLIIRTSFRPANWGFPTAFTNVFTSADYTDVIAGEIALCLRAGIAGTIHVGTPVKSFHELATRRNPGISPEECTDPTFPKRRDLNIERWRAIRAQITEEPTR